MRKLVSLKRIDKITPMVNADSLELAHIGGWQCVVSKDKFDPGDVVVFFEIDSALPVTDERYKFLHKKCLYTAKHNGEEIYRVVRIRTMHLRGTLSQGLVMPLSEFPEILTDIFKQLDNDHTKTITEIIDNADWAQLLGVRNFSEIQEHVANLNGSIKWGAAQHSFPTYLVPKTDAERIQNLPHYFDGRFADVLFEITEKVDGTSATYIWAPEVRPEEPRFMCSRNYELKLGTDDNIYSAMEAKYHIFECLRDYCTINSIGRDKPLQLAIQGEISGPGINGNRNLDTEHTFKVFRIFNVTDRKWLSSTDRRHICNMFRIPHVKVLAEATPLSAFSGMEAVLEFAKGTTDRGNPREGAVWKSANGTVTFKALNNDYLLADE